jgi:hypothetical protein
VTITMKVSSLLVMALLGMLLLGGCGPGNASSGASSGPSSTQKSSGSTQQASGNGGEKPVAAENNPTGDIPDTQAFVTYTSQQGNYAVEAPEGWARTVKGRDVSFVNKLDGMSVTLKSTAGVPTVESVRKNEVPALKKAGGAVQVSGVQDVRLPSGRAVLVRYTSNSKPNPVTGKQVRLENDSYVYSKNGEMATLRLYAPLGADNVDQWRRISRSFRWN